MKFEVGKKYFIARNVIRTCLFVAPDGSAYLSGYAQYEPKVARPEDGWEEYKLKESLTKTVYLLKNDVGVLIMSASPNLAKDPYWDYRIIGKKEVTITEGEGL